MSGMEILGRLREREDQYSIPVIVLTADVDAEVDSLDIGAADFIPKPYPKRKVINARIRRTIELSEKRFLLGRTEFDSPDVDTEVLIHCSEGELLTGAFYDVLITDATEFDLMGTVVK
jgi:DNA-binding response OmpR family regulator